MNRCCNIDWLEVYCTESSKYFPCDADFYTHHGIGVERRDYGTRVYAEMFTILDEKGMPFVEVRRHPLSDASRDGGLFPKEACHIKLSNYYCYSDDPIGKLRSFLAKFDYTFVKIFRIDICNDFEKFDKGDDPANFLKRYLDGKYSKLNQSNVSAYGKDTWERREWNSVSWGKKKSMISTKLYCKSLEMQEVHAKPYICWSWFQNGLIDDPVNITKRNEDGTIYKPSIWRVEFSIKSSAKRWFIIENAETRHKRDIYMPHTLSMYDNPAKLQTIFASLAQHYFHFKHYEDGKRKDRCKDKELFTITPSDTFVKPDRQVAQRKASTLDDRLTHLLLQYAAFSYNPEIKQAIDTLLKFLEDRRTRAFAGNFTTSDDCRALQLLIARRLGKPSTESISRQLEEIKDIIQECEGNLF